MKLSNQCCTLEQGRKLKKMGVIENSAFAWVSVCYDPLGERDPAMEVVYRDDYTSISAKHGEYMAPAFTVAELGAMLPDIYTSWREDDIWCCSYSPDYPLHMQGRTQAEAMAEELISHMQVGTLGFTAEEVNNRLINS